MRGKIQCPRCASRELDPCNFESMIVIARDHALFTMHCPSCGARVTSIQAIPPELKQTVLDAARSIGAGMGMGC